jgi:hypothetical protein
LTDDRPVAALDRNLTADFELGQRVEAELDRFISQQHTGRVREEGDGRPKEAAWKESERRAEAARRAENARAWQRVPLGRRRERHKANFALLIAHHEREGVIDGALGPGQSPRSIIRRYAGLSRKALTRHRDKGHHERGPR